MARKIQIDLFDRIKELDQDKLLREVWDDSLTQDYIIELNTIEQLFKKSQLSDGELLPPYALDSYLGAKKSLGLAPSGLINLRLSDRYYNTYEVIPNSTGFVIESNTNLYPESGDFINIYGPNIQGLTEESKQALQIFVKDLFNEKIRLFLDLD
jgi:hypothetical protein